MTCDEAQQILLETPIIDLPLEVCPHVRDCLDCQYAVRDFLVVLAYLAEFRVDIDVVPCGGFQAFEERLLAGALPGGQDEWLRGL